MFLFFCQSLGRQFGFTLRSVEGEDAGQRHLDSLDTIWRTSNYTYQSGTRLPPATLGFQKRRPTPRG
jgi:hypothetical protein